MPDANGEKTLRERYPIYCDGCKEVIQDNDYRVTGLYLDAKDIPVCRYGHTACLKPAEYATTTIARDDSLDALYCVYCNAETESQDFVCDECRDRIKRELRKAEPSEAVIELLDILKGMRQPSSSHSHSNGHESKSEMNRAVLKPSELGYTDDDFGPFVPTNENGVILMVGGIMADINYRIVAMPNQYPDAVAISPSKKVINVEFEYASGNFIQHGHDPALCDMVICWKKDRNLPVPILELSRFYNAKTGHWDFRQAAQDVI